VNGACGDFNKLNTNFYSSKLIFILICESQSSLRARPVGYRENVVNKEFAQIERGSRARRRHSNKMQ